MDGKNITELTEDQKEWQRGLTEFFKSPEGAARIAEVLASVGLCVFCGRPAEGNYSIHRDGFGIGPEVPLCDGCGSKSEPTCAEIWSRIANRTN